MELYLHSPIHLHGIILIEHFTFPISILYAYGVCDMFICLNHQRKYSLVVTYVIWLYILKI